MLISHCTSVLSCISTVMYGHNFDHSRSSERFYFYWARSQHSPLYRPILPHPLGLHLARLVTSSYGQQQQIRISSSDYSMASVSVNIISSFLTFHILLSCQWCTIDPSPDPGLFIIAETNPCSHRQRLHKVLWTNTAVSLNQVKEQYTEEFLSLNITVSQVNK